MVAHKMGSQRGGSNGIGLSQAQNHDPKSIQLSRKGSLYRLTFAEMENQLGVLGKTLSSMNLAELLKTLYQAEANDFHLSEGADSRPFSWQMRQPELLSSKKTVDEVWHDIQQEQKTGRLDRKMTLGEITIEDFLVKAAVVTGNKNQGLSLGGVDSLGLSQQVLSMNYPIHQPHHDNSIMPVFMAGAQPIIPIGENPEITTSSCTLSDNTQMSGRKRAGPSDVVEKSVERRQKRMIKNRESAARSRARKQAYTHELENKVSRLEEENKRLKRQKEWEKVLPSIPPPEPKYQLRRTSSAPL